MNKTYLLLTLFILILVVIMFACTPKNTKEPNATEDKTAGLQMESETAQDTAPIPDSMSADTAFDNKQFIPSSDDPPAQNFFEYLDYERRTFSEIKFWGWSRDGKVAYSNFITLESSDLDVIIFDIIDDTVLWRNRLDLFDDPHLYEENYDWFKGKYYLDFINNFKKICVQNGIEFIQTKFKNIPIKHDNQTVNIILEKNESPLSFVEGDSLGIMGKYESYKIIATHQGKQKIIKEKSFSNNIYADDVFICGYFLSPFENRALIVIGEFAHSWEGSDVTYHFAGCHLSMGFR